MWRSAEEGVKVHKTRGVVVKISTAEVKRFPRYYDVQSFTVFLDRREGRVRRVKAFVWRPHVEGARRAKAWREMKERQWKEREGEVLSDKEIFNRKLAALSF